MDPILSGSFQQEMTAQVGFFIGEVEEFPWENVTMCRVVRFPSTCVVYFRGLKLPLGCLCAWEYSDGFAAVHLECVDGFPRVLPHHERAAEMVAEGLKTIFIISYMKRPLRCVRLYVATARSLLVSQQRLTGRASVLSCPVNASASNGELLWARLISRVRRLDHREFVESFERFIG